MTCHDLYDDQHGAAGVTSVLHPRLVVGVDGSPGSVAAMHWATDQARMTGASLEAVYVLEPVVPLDFTGASFAAVSQLDTRELHRTAHEVMTRVIREAADGLAGDVQQVVLENANPGQALVRIARDASMLVVGAHSHHGLGFLLGSTGASCVRHSTCPVVVVPESWYAPSGAHSTAQREEAMS